MLQVGQVIRGYVSCGTKNPFYNKQVLLKVVFVIDNDRVEVQTVNTELFEHHVDTFNKNHELIKSETVYEYETYTGWLDVNKKYEIVK